MLQLWIVYGNAIINAHDENACLNRIPLRTSCDCTSSDWNDYAR